MKTASRGAPPAGGSHPIIKSLQDPQSFLFQFLALFLTLFLLTKLSCWFGCFATGLGTTIVLVYISWELAHLIQKRFFHELIDGAGKAVLVTGCDTVGGFGYRLANRLSSQGFLVFAGCLDPNGAGSVQLAKTSVVVMGMDVTSDESVAAAMAEIKTKLQKERKTLWAVVNNAGIFKVAHVEWGTLADYQQVIDVNVMGVVRVTRAVLPLLRQSKGRVVNVASIAGRIAGPGLAIYSMSKHAVVAFSTALRREMLPWSVAVSTIEPAIYKTPMADLDALERGARAIWSATTPAIQSDYGKEYFEGQTEYLMKHTSEGRENPEEVVDAMMDAITALKPQIRYKVCGPDYAITWLLSDWLPFSIVDWLGKFRGSKTKPSGVTKH